jgi:isoamylase
MIIVMFEKETLQRIGIDKNFTPNLEAIPGHSQKMGISIEDGGCNVSIWAGSADSVEVCIFDKRTTSDILANWQLIRDSNRNGVFCGFIPDLKPGDIYGIRPIKEYGPQQSVLIDPYAKALTNEPRPKSIIVDEFYDWENDNKPNIPQNEMIIYEGHVKGLTRKLEKIPENIRGTYAGIASKEFINHLKSLSVTSLELMPVQHFLTESHVQQKGLTDYWGYNTIGFFSPHADYSSSGKNGEQVHEFKDMVKKLHSAGIEVILDVVYNHSAEESDNGPILSFKGLGENEYYHVNNGKHCNYTGCGNTIDVSSDVGLEFILDSLRYWANDMHVDGFRFDLAPSLAREGQNHSVNMNGRFMNAIKNDPIISKLKLIAEPWDCGSYELGSYQKPWLTWNDQFRNSVRDFWRGNGDLGDFAGKLAGSGIPSHSVNYVTSHDGLTLNDLVSYEQKYNYANGENNRDGTDDNRSYNFGIEGATDDIEIVKRRIKVAKGLFLSTMLAMGTPMISHGDEMLRTQSGNNNAYCQDNETTWIDWSSSETQNNFLDYVQKVASIRKNNPVFQQSDYFTGQPNSPDSPESDLTWFRDDGLQFEHDDSAWHRKQIIGKYLSGIAIKNSINETIDGHTFLYYSNGTHSDYEINLPVAKPYAGVYELVVDTSAENIDQNSVIVVDSEKLVLKSLSSVLLKKIASNI